MTGPAAIAESRCETLSVRGVRYNVRRWGKENGEPVLLLHGTQDCSITFQFVVDCLQRSWSVAAPDWRGHGLSQWVSQGYWFHEFIADLDVLTDALFGGRPVPIVGHSLGGNIAGVYAGLRPERVSHLVSLDGFGPLTSRLPVDVPAVLTRFLDMPRRRREHAVYASVHAVAERLKRGNPRLSLEKALFLAEHSSVDTEGGRRWRFDPSHQASLPSLHTIKEWGSVWARVAAPTLWVSSGDARPHAPVAVPGEMRRSAALAPPHMTHVALPDTGHNLHHDDPASVARLLEDFVQAGRSERPRVLPRAIGQELYSACDSRRDEESQRMGQKAGKT